MGCEHGIRRYCLFSGGRTCTHAGKTVCVWKHDIVFSLADIGGVLVPFAGAGPEEVARRRWRWTESDGLCFYHVSLSFYCDIYQFPMQCVPVPSKSQFFSEILFTELEDPLEERGGKYEDKSSGGQLGRGSTRGCGLSFSHNAQVFIRMQNLQRLAFVERISFPCISCSGGPRLHFLNGAWRF